ncbi:flagellar motor protein MotB [Actinotalea sp. K2]|uniref:flagellar motor protein MotB n=1 Tax=Actinotalea sp. K2 TaxID=2939438 RepID=UPI002016D5AE|nr:flagellar motor protein MotB [Actinotalea sp. K2]MCL3860866.1 OmpA family protein [Actinotalea sp. K2]
MSAGHGSGGHGRKGGRRGGAHEEEEHENHERWAVSYADMMTVLVGLFIVMYAMSSVDEVKYEQLRDSLAAGFGNRAPSMLEGSSGALTGTESFQITPDIAKDTGILSEQIRTLTATPTTTDLTLTEQERTALRADAEFERLEAIADQISAALTEQALADRVRFRVTERGLVIGMVADDVFFQADAATLTETAQRVLDTMAPVLVGITDEISIEGHANVLPTARYPTNWELSSDRATQVLRRLVETGGLPAQRVAAVGFGEARPLEEAGGVAALDANRRVDLVVLSAAPETVRALLPAIAAREPR